MGSVAWVRPFYTKMPKILEFVCGVAVVVWFVLSLCDAVWQRIKRKKG